jgi:pimeloyl-ACP methyl ester carboxylesterase
MRVLLAFLLLGVAPLGRLVDVGGRRLHVHCTGKGPTVLLIPGAGAFSFDWSLVRAKAEGSFRVCSADRAGFAWSDPPAGDVSAAGVAADLRAALRGAGERAPYVVVGHSYGAIYARVLQQRWPDEVAGMVLVDPSHEDMLLAVGRMGSKTMRVVKPRLYASDAAWAALFDGAGDMEPCSNAAEDSDPNPPKAAEGRDFPPAVRKLRQWAQSAPGFMDLDFSYREAMRRDLAELHAARQRNQQPLGNTPLVVIAAGAVDPGDGPKISAAQAAALRRHRPLLMFDLLRLSARSELWLSPGSSHDVHVDDPEIVVRGIRKLGRPP